MTSSSSGPVLSPAAIAAAALPVLLGAVVAWTQASPTLRVVVESGVTDDPPGVYVEPTLAVDPEDPDRMVAAAIHLREPRSDDWQDRQTVVVLESADGGRTWRRRPLDGLPTDWAAGDPWLAWGSGSRVYLSAIVAEALTRPGAVQFTGVFTSDDGGTTWSGPVRPFPGPTMQDHPVVSAADPGLAIAGSIADRTGDGVYIVRGDPDGNRFDTARRVEPGWPQVNLGGAALLDDGAIVISYYTMQPPRRYAVRRIEPDGTPGAETILGDAILPVGFPPVSARANGERVAALWAEGPEPRIKLRLALSDDGGRSWTPGGAIEAGDPPALRTLPALAMAPSGAIAAIWQQFAEGGGCTDLYGAVSTDEGRSFGPTSRLSSEASCFGTEANGAAVSRFRLGGGDYIGLAAAGEDSFQAVWADSRDGTFQIRTARLAVAGR